MELPEHCLLYLTKFLSDVDLENLSIAYGQPTFTEFLDRHVFSKKRVSSMSIYYKIADSSFVYSLANEKYRRPSSYKRILDILRIDRANDLTELRVSGTSDPICIGEFLKCCPHVKRLTLDFIPSPETSSFMLGKNIAIIFNDNINITTICNSTNTLMITK